MVAILFAPSAHSDDPGAAIARSLAAGSFLPVVGPADSWQMVQAQLAAGVPWPEGIIWGRDESGVVLHVSPGAKRGLDPGFARALSAELGGLVLAMEAARTTELYLLGSFLAGRTIELSTCDAGRVTGPGGRGMCDEDQVVARFTRWLGGVNLQRLRNVGGSGLLAAGSGTWSEEEAPLARIALLASEAPDMPGWRRRSGSRVVVFTRDGDLGLAELTSFGIPAVALSLPGRGGAVKWFVADENRELRSGIARGHDELTRAVPGWALE